MSQADLVKAVLFFPLFGFIINQIHCVTGHSAVPSTTGGNKKLPRNGMYCVVAGEDLLFPTSLAHLELLPMKLWNLTKG